MKSAHVIWYEKRPTLWMRSGKPPPMGNNAASTLIAIRFPPVPSRAPDDRSRIPAGDFNTIAERLNVNVQQFSCNDGHTDLIGQP
jgi:hypothetical protein